VKHSIELLNAESGDRVHYRTVSHKDFRDAQRLILWNDRYFYKWKLYTSMTEGMRLVYIESKLTKLEDE
jgi:hypothetical protein